MVVTEEIDRYYDCYTNGDVSNKVKLMKLCLVKAIFVHNRNF